MSATQPHNPAADERDEHICIDGNCPCNHDRPEDGFSVEEMTAMLEEISTVSFELGELILTPGAQRAVVALGINPAQLIDRHRDGDWGDVGEGDRIANENALKTGARIWSVYNFDGLEDGRLYVITDGDDDAGRRHATTILLPSEY